MAERRKQMKRTGQAAFRRVLAVLLSVFLITGNAGFSASAETFTSAAAESVPASTEELTSVSGETFSLIGILSKLSGILADHKIGIFAVSTYNTEYILVKEENFERTMDVLVSEGYTVV